jgi:pseudouridine kinase
MTGKILCIGAAHLDRKARAIAAVVTGSSNPVRLSTGWGGVARNVAETLVRLGAPVGLVSRVGADAEADRLIEALAALGIDTGLIVRVPGAATASYTALLDPAGELVIGLADMAIYDGMDAAFFAPLKPRLAGHAAWFVDANLPAAGLAALLADKPAGTLVAADAVSVAKAPRLVEILPRIDLLFCNMAEAAALAGPGPGVEAMARSLLARGPGAVVLTQGARGALCADADGVQQLPAATASLRDVTGAGDSLVAATLLARLGGLKLAAALARGLAAAALTIASEHAVRPDLSPAMVAAALGPAAA